MERVKVKTWLILLIIAVLAIMVVYIIKSYENIITITDATLI